jgi:hypothetical protein
LGEEVKEKRMIVNNTKYFSFAQVEAITIYTESCRIIGVWKGRSKGENRGG